MALNCPQYFVATLDEAIQLRQINTQSPVAVLGGLFHSAEKEYIAHNIIPVLNSPDDIGRWKEQAHKEGKTLPAFLHLDTGMNRLGLSFAETNDVVGTPALLDGIDIQTVMTHFVCADEKDHPLTQRQADDFAQRIRHFPKAKRSLANSPGLFRNDTYHYDIVRPGYALYGGNPTPERCNPMRSVVDISVRILQIRLCKKRETIGYGASHKFEKDTMTATIGLGYADGFLRTAQAEKIVYWQGQACPVIGRVSMDLATVDISHFENPPIAGDYLEIVGPHQTVDDLAGDMGTIGYEILTSLGRRYERVYEN